MLIIKDGETIKNDKFVTRFITLVMIAWGSYCLYGEYKAHKDAQAKANVQKMLADPDIAKEVVSGLREL